MSLRYRDKNGVETVVSGLTPGGNIEYGAVATRKGTVSVTGPGSFNTTNDIVITFDEPMPDANYIVDIASSGADLEFTILLKTANGFRLRTGLSSNAGAGVTATVTWYAAKLYDVADAEQLYSQLQDISAMVPANASNVNQFSTKSDLQAVNRSLDMRLDDIEDVVPTTATIANKLATAADVAEAMANAGLKVTDTIPANPSDGDVLLYIGTETGFTKGGIYQYTANPGAWVLISTAEVDLSAYSTSFVGTTAQWNALSSTDKNKYVLVNLTDDQEALGMSVVDAVTDGDMRPVTSNAVYDEAAKKIDKIKALNNNNNLNDIVTSGYYTWGANTPTNAPDAYMTMHVWSGNDSWVNQYCRSARSGSEMKEWKRYQLSDGTWSTWQRIDATNSITSNSAQPITSGAIASTLGVGFKIVSGGLSANSSAVVNFDTSTRGIIYIIGAGVETLSEFLMNTDGSGQVSFNSVLKGTAINYSISSKNKVTLTNSGNTNPLIYVQLFTGSCTIT